MHDASINLYLDRFNRITTSVWASIPATPHRNFYEVALSYHRNSNITWAEDNVHAGFDVKYTMDDLDRLIDAEEGTRSSGSIASRTRHQTWMHSSTSQLSHTGNWARSRLDLDGDDNWNETDEHDDTRTHNKVNELLTRDTDSNASTNYTLAYDAAGNMTGDGEAFEFEYDAFYRLRKVKNQSSTVLAEYRYNGLGHMIMVWEDTEADSDLDGSDVKFWPVYDEGWREVARYRESDASPKEQFVNAMAGLDGYGGSSYINDVVCRNRDNTSGWLAASDGTLEERYYYCPNWRGDVSALVTSDRKLHEMVKYSPYGIPFGLPGGDTNSDGDNDAADATQIQTWIDAPAYDVRGDVDLDGDVDVADKTLAQAAPVGGTPLGLDRLSSLRNRRAYGGTEQLACSSVIGRMRKYSPRTGVWASRDSLVYVDGPVLYQFGRSSPLSYLDPFGTRTLQRRTQGNRPLQPYKIVCGNLSDACCNKLKECMECIAMNAATNAGCAWLDTHMRSLRGTWTVNFGQLPTSPPFRGLTDGNPPGGPPPQVGLPIIPNGPWEPSAVCQPGGTIFIDPNQQGDVGHRVLHHEVGHANLHEAASRAGKTQAENLPTQDAYHNDNILDPGRAAADACRSAGCNCDLGGC